MTKMEKRFGVSRHLARAGRHHFQTSIPRVERLFIRSKNFAIRREHLGSHEIKKPPASVTSTPNQVDIGISKIYYPSHIDVGGSPSLFHRIQRHLSPAGTVIILEVTTGYITIGDETLCAKPYELSHGIGPR